MLLRMRWLIYAAVLSIILLLGVNQVVKSPPHWLCLLGGRTGPNCSLATELTEPIADLDWIVRAEPWPGVSLNAVAYGDGRFVAAGEPGIVMASPDGIAWTQTATLPIGYLQTIAYSNGLWLVGGGDGAIFTSTDTVEWTRRTPSAQRGIWSIAASQGRLVAVGDGPPLTSDDGMAWTVRRSNPDLTDILWNGARFVGAGPFTTIASSPDGVSFTPLTVEQGLPRTIRLNGLEHLLSGIAQGPDRYVVVGGIDNSGSVLVSENGQVWRRQLWVWHSLRRVHY